MAKICVCHKKSLFLPVLSPLLYPVHYRVLNNNSDNYRLELKIAIIYDSDLYIASKSTVATIATVDNTSPADHINSHNNTLIYSKNLYACNAIIATIDKAYTNVSIVYNSKSSDNSNIDYINNININNRINTN